MTQEEWRPIPGYDGLYEVSNCGRVRSYRHNRWGRSETPKIICGDNGHYLGVTLCKNGQNRQYIHKLVAEVFIPNPNHLSEVNHIDGDKRNNRVENLEWCSHKENMQHAADHALFKNRQRAVVCEETGEAFVSVTAAAKSVCGAQPSLSKSLLYGTGEYKGRTFRFLEV